MTKCGREPEKKNEIYAIPMGILYINSFLALPKTTCFTDEKNGNQNDYPKKLPIIITFIQLLYIRKSIEVEIELCDGFEPKKNYKLYD